MKHIHRGVSVFIGARRLGLGLVGAALIGAGLLGLPGSVAAQGNDSATGHDRTRGELSPGTAAPSQDDLMAAIEGGSPERLARLLEYGERVECHSCVPLLQRQILENADAKVREMAAWWLRRRPFGFAAVFREIRAVLADDADPVRRARAAEALGEFMDPHGIPHLAVALEDEDARVRAAAVRGLGRINAPAAVTGIVQAFGDADATVREAAVAQVLYVNFFRDYEALMGLLADGEVEVRRRAALALGSFRVAEATPALGAMLRGDAEPMARQAAAWALGRIGSGDAREALGERREAEEVSLVRDAIEVALRMRH